MIGITTLLITTVAAFVLFVVLGLALGHRRDRIAADHYMKSLEEFKRANKEAEANGEPLFCESTKKPSENLYREVLTTTQSPSSTDDNDEYGAPV